MILSTRKTSVYLCKKPTDMRLGFDGLSLLVKKTFGRSPYGGQYYAFVNRRRKRSPAAGVKVLLDFLGSKILRVPRPGLNDPCDFPSRGAKLRQVGKKIGERYHLGF